MSQTALPKPPSPLQLRDELETMVLKELLGPGSAEDEIIESPGHSLLRHHGLDCSENFVAKLMKAWGIRAKMAKRFVRTTDSRHDLAASTALIFSGAPECRTSTNRYRCQRGRTSGTWVEYTSGSAFHKVNGVPCFRGGLAAVSVQKEAAKAWLANVKVTKVNDKSRWCGKLFPPRPMHIESAAERGLPIKRIGAILPSRRLTLC